MTLTGSGLLAVLALLTAALLAAVIGLWPRLAGRGVAVLLARIAFLGVLELTVLSLIFVAVNRSGGFYSSWSDLLGRAGGRAAVAGGQQLSGNVSGGRPGPAVTVTATAAVRVRGRARKQQVGRLQTVRLHGVVSGLTVTGYVYLPAGYSTAAGSRPLPVAVLISDQVSGTDQVSGAAPGSVTPAGVQRLAQTAAREMAGGRLRPLILVMLPARIGPEQGCLNAPGGPQAGTFFGQDVPHVIDAAYRAASPGPGRWALLADTSGGYCALQLALTQPQSFPAASVPPGNYRAPPGLAAPRSPQLRTQDDLQWLLRHQPVQPVSVLFAGRTRPRQWLALARPPMRVTSIEPASGQWPQPAVLDWISRQLSPAAAAGLTAARPARARN